MGVGQGGHGGVRLVAPATQHRDQERSRVEEVLPHRAEHAVRAELQEGPYAFGFQGACRVQEAHGPADVPDPVLGRGQFLGADRLPGQGGDDRDGGRGEREPLRDRLEFVQHRVHVRGVEGVADAQLLGLASLGGEFGSDGLDGFRVAREHHGGGAVDGGDAQQVLPSGEQRQHLLLLGLHGEHRAAAGQCLHQPAAGRDELRRVRQREDAGDVRGGQLTDGVTREEGRPYAPAFEEPEERDLGCEQGGLREAGLVQRRRVLTEEDVEQRRFQPLVELFAYGVQGLGVGGVGGVQLPAHTESLAALTGEEEGRTAVHGCTPHGQFRESVGRFGGGGGHHHGAVRQSGPSDGQGPARRCQVLLPGVGEGRAHLVGLRQQGRVVVRGQQQRNDRHRLGRRDRPLGRRLLHDDVGIGTADAEGGHACPARPLGLGPRHRLGEQFHLAGGPVHVRAGLVDVKALGEHPVLHRHDHLDDTGHTGGGLGVSDVGLQGAHQEGGRALLPVGGEYGPGLDRVAQRGAGAVGLQRVHVRGGQARVGQGLTDHPLLGGAVGSGEAVACTVLVDCGSADHTEDPAAVALCVGESLQQEDSGALGPGRPVRLRGEGLASAVRRQSALPAELDEQGRSGQYGHTAGQGQPALAVPQRLGGEVDGDERGGAGGVDGDRRSLQAEGVGDAAGGDTDRAADRQVALQGLGGVLQACRVVVGHDTGEHTGLAALERGRVDARALEGLPADFQQQALLRVDGGGLPCAHPEELGVELRSLVEESAVPGVRGAHVVGVRVVQAVQVPAAVVRERADGVPLVGQQRPQLLRGADLARVAAGHRDDRDRLVGGADDRFGLGHRGGRAEQFGPQEAGQLDRVRVVEHQRRGQLQTCGRVQPVAQFHCLERVEAQLVEGAVGRDLVGVGVPQYGGHHAADQFQQRALLVLEGQGRQAFLEGVPARLLADGGAPRRTHQAVEERGQGAVLALCPQSGVVQQRRNEHRPTGRKGRVEQRQPLLAADRGDAAPGHAGEVGVGQVTGHPAALGPQAPGQRRTGQAQGLAVVREGVQIGVGRGVVGLSRGADRTGQRGEQDERVQLQVGRQLVQVPGGIDLGTQYGVELLGREGVQRAVVEDAGGVQDRGERVLRGDRVQHRGDRHAVGRVTGDHGHVGSVGREFAAGAVRRVRRRGGGRTAGPGCRWRL